LNKTVSKLKIKEDNYKTKTIIVPTFGKLSATEYNSTPLMRQIGEN